MTSRFWKACRPAIAWWHLALTACPTIPRSKCWSRNRKASRMKRKRAETKSESARGFVLVFALLQAGDLPDPDGGAAGRLSCVHHSRFSFSGNKFPPYFDWSRQRRNAHRPDDGHNHAAFGGGREQRPRTSNRALHYQPRLSRDRSFLRLERGYVPDAAICERSDLACSTGASLHRNGSREPADLCQLPDHGLQPDCGHSTADATLGDGDLRDQAAVDPARWCVHRAHPRRTDTGVSHHT